MKRSIFPAVVAGMMLACYAPVKAQTADEIVKKHVDAIGGLDAWKKVNSMKLTGSMNAGGVEFPVSITTVNGKGYRMEFSISGMTNYMILTPTEGWMYFPIQGQTKPEPVTPEMIKEEQDQLDVSMDPLIDYAAKGNTISSLGKDQVEGTECHKLKVVHKNGKEETMYIDASNYYCIRVTEKTKANGKEMESVSNFSNYQKLPEGITFPMSIDSDGGPVTLKSVEVNKPIDENTFKPTEPKK